MELNKRNIKKIIFLMLVAGVILWTVLNTSQALAAIGWVINLLNPLIIGFAMAFVLNVLMRGIENHAFRILDAKFTKLWPRARRGASLGLSILLLIAIITIMFVLLIPAIGDAWGILVSNFPGYWAHLQDLGMNIAEKWGINLPKLPDLSPNYEEITKKLQSFAKTGAFSAFGSAVGFMTSLLGKIVSAALGFVIALYMLAGKEKLASQVEKLIRAYCSETVAKEIFFVGRTANDIFSKFIIGQVTDASILGCMCFAGMLILKMPYAGMIAILIGFTALIPIFGALIGTGIGAFLILMTSPIKALWFILMVLVLQEIDGKLIYPRVVGSSVGLPALWTLLAVLIGGSMGGLVGMLIGVPTAALAYTLLRRSVNKKLGE